MAPGNVRNSKVAGAPFCFTLIYQEQVKVEFSEIYSITFSTLGLLLRILEFESTLSTLKKQKITLPGECITKVTLTRSSYTLSTGNNS